MKTFARWVWNIRQWNRRLEQALTTRQCRRSQPGIEQLESRCLLDAGFRSITGFGNNLDHPTYGQAGTDLLRISPVAYADGISTPSQPNTLSPREISNNLNNQSDPIFSGNDNLGAPQSKSLSDFAYVWGQFTDHDLDLTTTTSGQSFAIPADTRTFPGPNGTQITDPMGAEPFTRSTFDPTTGTSTSNPRQQVNANTSFLDLSQVYGSTQVVADALRTFQGGLLKTSPGDLLPFNNLTYFTQDQLNALNMANDAHQVPDSQLFAAGDVRANENIELTAIQTLFVRNHNRLAKQLEDLHPTWTDQQLYQEARKLNIAEAENITYTEFLPAIFGSNAIPAYTGYKDEVNPSISTEFSTVGFRFGHTLLSNSVGRVNNDGTSVADKAGFPGSGGAVNLTADFFDPNLINPNGVIDPLTGQVSTGIGAILKADASNTANEMDLLLIDEIRNQLFGIPIAPGTDLAARDVQRARDHGIGTYNQVRVAYGLKAVASFADITTNVTIQNELKATYGTVDQIDPFEGMLAEDHLPGSDAGPTETAIVIDQFRRLRDGDRFFYLNEPFTTEQVGLFQQGNTLAKIIQNNTGISNLQSNVFFFKESISGTVFSDADTDGLPRTTEEAGMSGITVNLNDNSGNVVATTTTDSQGHYSFTDQTGIPGTGKFTVSIVVPLAEHQTTTPPATIALSRGSLDFDGVDFGIAANAATGVQVSLHAAFNQVGIVSDGSTFSGGLDGSGAALSGNLLGTSQTWNGTVFTLGAVGGKNVVSADGQTITLPAGSFTRLSFLATAVNGNQPNQTFTVTYTDGTTATFTQSISDWFTPQKYTGESDAVDLAYRDLFNGTKDNREFHLCGYSFALDPTKNVKSITLPDNDEVKLLALSLS